MSEVEILREKLEEARRLVAKLYCASGCECCRNEKEWDSASDALGELFGVPRTDDGYWIDWYTVNQD